MVKLPEEYRFSSYRYYALGLPDAVVSDSPAYCSLSDSPEVRANEVSEAISSGLLRRYAPRNDKFYRSPPLTDALQL